MNENRFEIRSYMSKISLILLLEERPVNLTRASNHEGKIDESPVLTAELDNVNLCSDRVLVFTEFTFST